VKLGVFAAYVKSVGVLLSVLTVVFYILYNAANLYSNIWLSEWSNDVTHYNMSANFTVDTAQRDMRLGIYGLLGFIQGTSALRMMDKFLV
jgi:hypothetical protein